MKIASSGTPYQRPGGAGDTYDSFKGFGLAGTGAGSFSDSFAENSTQTVKASAQAVKELRQQLSGTKFRNVRVDPDAQMHTTHQRSEVFKGVTLFNRWRIGHFTVSESSKNVTEYKVHAEIPIGGGAANTKLTMSRTEIGENLNRSGWYFFD